MIRKYIIIAEDSIKGFDEEIARLEREWGAEEIEPCEDAVSCERVKQLFLGWAKKQESNIKSLESISKFFAMLYALPNVTPKYTDEEIQKMQELEQAQLEKAYELGMQTSIEEWISSFNTESAPQCFNAVQELKKKLEGDTDDK